MKTRELLKRLEGIQTIPTVISALDVDRQQANYYIYRLRKKGYVRTRRLSDNRRVYSISFENRLKGTSYYDIINSLSPIKITTPKTYRIYGKEPSYEEILVFAIKTGSLRTILASLALFRRIDDWSALYRLAKKDNIERQVGALYDLARKVMKTRRMTARFRNNALPGKSFVFLIKGMRSKDFADIEKTWKVYLPFNRNDLEGYT